jgi:hypothetical protein
MDTVMFKSAPNRPAQRQSIDITRPTIAAERDSMPAAAAACYVEWAYHCLHTPLTSTGATAVLHHSMALREFVITDETLLPASLLNEHPS